MTQPSSLSSLLSWYRAEVDAAIPQRIHSRSIDDAGAPQWHGAFRAWLTAHPATEDKEGHVVSPLRYWLWRLGGNRAKFLKLLAVCDFDWRQAARFTLVIDDDAAHDYTRETLRRLHRLMYTDGVPNEPQRMALGDCAAQGCPNKTPRLYCPEHAKERVA